MNEVRKEGLPVSVIIPVRNVNKGLEQCLDTVRKQTFEKYEILLLPEGSGTAAEAVAACCREWAETDCRIRCVSAGGQGVVSAENQGIQSAAGRYLVLVDADEWLDERFLERMYDAAISADADLTECDVWQWDESRGTKAYHCCYGSMGQSYTLAEHMQYGNPKLGKCLIRKEFIMEHQIEFPDCSNAAGAMSVYVLMLALGNKVHNIWEPLYNQRIVSRDGNIRNSLPLKSGKEFTDTAAIIKAFEHLLREFGQRGLEQQYQQVLERTVKYRLSMLLADFFYNRDRHDFNRLNKSCNQFIADHFPEQRKCTYITLGSRNLNNIMTRISLLHNPYCRFNFSSLIGIMNPMKKHKKLVHRDKYQETMLNREAGNRFLRIVNEMKPQYLFLDFLEERFDVVECYGGYLTMSDALDNCETRLGSVRAVSRDSDEGMELWEQSCLDFIMSLRIGHPEIKIVLVKNYLSERYGDIYDQERYQDIEQIRGTNHILERYYDFFSRHCREATVIEASACQYYFTDSQRKGGIVPSHLNLIVYGEIARMIEERIDL